MNDKRKYPGRYRWLAFVVLVIAQASVAGARELSDQIAMQVLIEAKAVEFGGGEHPFEPTPILAVKLLLRSSQAGELFREVYQRSFGPPGKVYALIGLDKIGDPKFESLRSDFMALDSESVEYINGCFFLGPVEPREFLEEWLKLARVYHEFNEEKPGD